MHPGTRQHGRFVIPLLACVLLIGCREKESAPDYAVQKEFTQDSLRVQIELSSGQILLSDLLAVRISVTFPDGVEVQWPDFAETLRDFQVRDWDDLGRQLLSDGKVQSVRQYRLEPLKAGDLQIPPLSFQCTPDAQAAPLVLTTESLPVTVSTSLPEDLSQVSLADIEEIVEIKGHAFAVWMAVIAALAVAAAGAVIFLRSRSKQAMAAQKIYKPAHEIALARIRDLAGRNLIEQGRVKEFYERLSNCLRHYIENRFSLRAPERTTEEFLNELKGSSALAPDHKQELREFLEHSDLVKFAKHQPNRQQSDQSLKMAERFVENTKSDQQLVEVGPEGEEA
jgi:hypothetical protein